MNRLLIMCICYDLWISYHQYLFVTTGAVLIDVFAITKDSLQSSVH